MRLYLDTSLIVTAHVREPASNGVVAWLDAHRDDRFVVSDCAIPEFLAALSMKRRIDMIDADAQATALAKLGDLVAGESNCLAVTREQFRLAAAFADNMAAGVRAGDALHLAIAADHAILLCTHDLQQANTGARLVELTECVGASP